METKGCTCTFPQSCPAGRCWGLAALKGSTLQKVSVSESVRVCISNDCGYLQEKASAVHQGKSGDLCQKYILFEVGSFQPAGCFPLLCLRTSLLLFLTAVFIEGFGERSCSHDEQMCVDGSEPLLQSGAPRQPTSVIAPSSLLLFFLRTRFDWPASLSSVP